MGTLTSRPRPACPAPSSTGRTSSFWRSMSTCRACAAGLTRSSTFPMWTWSSRGRTRRLPTCPRTRRRRRTPPSRTSSCRTSATGRPSSLASAACPPCLESCWPSPACATSACTRSCARTPTLTCTRPACSRTAAARSTAGRVCSASCSGRSGCMIGSTITPVSSRRRCPMSTRRRSSRSSITWCPSTAASRPISTGRSRPKAPACARSAARAASSTFSRVRPWPAAARRSSV